MRVATTKTFADNTSSTTYSTAVVDVNLTKSIQDAAAAQTTANSATTAASTAQTTANNAASAASTAQTTANNAASAASTAQTTADNAATAASTAQTTANNAASAASTAQTAADGAASAASAAQTTADNAVSAASAAQATADKNVKATVSCYYRSTTNSTPTISTSTTIGTADDTDNAWSYTLQKPKKNTYFYTCERYTLADNTVTFSTVRPMSNLTQTALWCSANNSTYVDGANIYAGSVTATQIDVANLFSENITASNFHLTGGSIYIETSETSFDKLRLVSPQQFAELSPSGLRVSNNVFSDKPEIWRINYTIGPSGPRSSRIDMNSLKLDGSWGLRARYTSESLYYLDVNNKSAGGIGSTWVDSTATTAYSYLTLRNTATQEVAYLDQESLTFKDTNGVTSFSYPKNGLRTRDLVGSFAELIATTGTTNTYTLQQGVYLVTVCRVNSTITTHNGAWLVNSYNTSSITPLVSPTATDPTTVTISRKTLTVTTKASYIYLSVIKLT